MCKLSKILAHQKLLPSQTEMREMRRWPFDKQIPPKRKIEWCPVCPLWWKSSCKLQGMYGLQGPTKENKPTSPFETIHSSYTNQTILTHSTRSNICSNNPPTPTSLRHEWTIPTDAYGRNLDFPEPLFFLSSSSSIVLKRLRGPRTYVQITKQNSHAATNIEQDQRINQPHQETSDIQDWLQLRSYLKEKVAVPV
jgi:hypothetical protein